MEYCVMPYTDQAPRLTEFQPYNQPTLNLSGLQAITKIEILLDQSWICRSFYFNDQKNAGNRIYSN